MMTKTCRVCGRKMALSDFVRDRCAALGVKYVCRQCYRDLRKTYPSYNTRREEE